jgi:light-regulated signal transduction histidine kinase (bacteriophytochrome)
MNTSAEVAALITTLHDAERRLEELTAGEVDSIMDHDGRTLLLRHAQDQLRHSEAANQALILELKSANEALEAFGASASHDLRSPLSHIMGFAQLLRDRVGPSLSARDLDYLTTILRAGLQMENLIDDLLRFSRTARTELRKTDVDTERLVKDALGDFQSQTAARNIVWQIHPLPTVPADRALLRMVLVNLLSNAVKFTGTRTEPRIEIGWAPGDGPETVIFVRDNGAGFDPQYADRLFGAFQRLHSQTEFEGTGIGLHTVQRIINRHGGRIWAEGAVDGGATFYFSIPQSSAQRVAH